MKKINITADRIVGEGACIATITAESGAETEDIGKKVFIWGAVPGEDVVADIYKERSKFCEATVSEVVSPSEHRIEPADGEASEFLSTAPWEIYDFAYENELKNVLIEEAFEMHNVREELPKKLSPIKTLGSEMSYRNKYTYSFTGENFEFAVIKRSTNEAVATSKISLPTPAIQAAAAEILKTAKASSISPSDLRSLTIRSNEKGSTVARLYIQTDKFSPKEWENLENFELFAYNQFAKKGTPNSKLLLATGTNQLSDDLLGNKFLYNITSFFQVNKPIYELFLKDLREFFTPQIKAGKFGKIVDFYSGVGTIGLSLSSISDEKTPLSLIELDKSSVEYAKLNVAQIQPKAKVVRTDAKHALEQIIEDSLLILDPPRAGLDKSITAKIAEVKPKAIAYLSCNPSTQARDVAKLLEVGYKITNSQGYNFFPRTPHIEHLVTLAL